MSTVRETTSADRDAWNEYARHHVDSHHAHRWEWREIIESIFKHKPYYLVAESDNSEVIKGLLPLFHFKSFLFGDALISMPYLNGGGILADDPLTFAALDTKAKELASNLNVDYVELRHRNPILNYGDTMTVRQHKVAVALTFQGDGDAVMKGFKSGHRRKIRLPAKRGYRAEIMPGDDFTPEILDAYYQVFSRHMRDLGTPVYPRQLFKTTLATFGQDAHICVAFKGDEPASCGITIAHRDRMEFPWVASLRKFHSDFPNTWLYWLAMEKALELGYKVFDMGRSSLDSGPLRFKQQWGGDEIPLHWYYHEGKGTVPDVNPNSGKFAAMVAVWRRLPIPVANTMGPYITRSLP